MAGRHEHQAAENKGIVTHLKFGLRDRVGGREIRFDKYKYKLSHVPQVCSSGYIRFYKYKYSTLHNKYRQKSSHVPRVWSWRVGGR